jgi:hypothetical protein
VLTVGLLATASVEILARDFQPLLLDELVQAVDNLVHAEWIRPDALPISFQPESRLLDPAQGIQSAVGEAQQLAVEGFVVHGNRPIEGWDKRA